MASGDVSEKRKWVHRCYFGINIKGIGSSRPRRLIYVDHQLENNFRCAPMEQAVQKSHPFSLLKSWPLVQPLDVRSRRCGLFVMGKFLMCLNPMLCREQNGYSVN